MSDEKSKTTATRVLTFVGLAVSVVAGGATLLFSLEPDLKPCIGGSEASFTGSPVFPQVSYKDHLLNIDTDPSVVETERRTDVGAEVRYSVRSSNLKDKTLEVRYSLVDVQRDDSLGKVDREQNRQLDVEFTPESCSTVFGGDLFVKIPVRKRRYRVVLEVYRGTDRIALAQTEHFTG